MLPHVTVAMRLIGKYLCEEVLDFRNRLGIALSVELGIIDIGTL
jgi:hypothetical protein